MTDRKPHEIEREIEEERSALQNSLDQLQSQFSPEALVNQTTEYLKTHGSDLGQTLARTARDNPMALALTGAGLAWLLVGSRDQDDNDDRYEAPYRPSVAYDDRSRPTASGFASPEPPMAGFDNRVAEADAAIRQSEYPASDQNYNDGDTDMTDRGYSSHDPAQGRIQNLKSRAYQTAADLRRRIDEGTADMPEAARDRVRRARAAAASAQEEFEYRAAQAAAKARQTAQQNPLLIGALAFAAGAALGASLPRTQTENRAVGSQRDRLFDEADRIFREEAEKMKHVAQAAVAEGQSMVKEAVSDARTDVDVKSGVSRLTEAAKSEAQKQRLGEAS